MKIAFFGAHQFEREFFDRYNARKGHEITFLEEHLRPETAVLAAGHDCVCVFVNDTVDATVLGLLAEQGIQLIAARSAGFNHIDLDAAKRLGIPVVRVPAYSPFAVAEHAVALILTLNRKTHRAFNRVRDGNFSLDGLLGFDLHGKTVGVIGTGKIGQVFAKIMIGFGCEVLAYDIAPNYSVREMGVQYQPLGDVLRKSDIVSLHCPLVTATHHLINGDSLARMKPGAMLINTSRGGLVDAKALIDALKSGHIGAVGLDVYEEEADLFFEDLSGQVIEDDVFARLLSFPNVLITGHQAFFTKEALQGIAMTTLDNVSEFEATGDSKNKIRGR
ncbi:2-hydroxyacid dehydrogenase [Bryobacter aggregatus]|uniref:2-hydroxyacid dehydrogenase n=1 Tax=Bryobacter aggregatus TaxID=360054 RepID=UPI0004E0E359|nr:2-hydroxyacid dehydrogenase [Bryobacter aggregatus]